MKKVEKLSEAVGEERVEHIMPLRLHKESLLDEIADEDLLDMENPVEEEDDGVWYGYEKVQKWSSFRNSLTKKDLKSIM